MIKNPPQDSFGTRLGMVGSGFQNWLDKPTWGIPVLGHFMGIPSALAGVGSSMLPNITPSGSPAFNEAAMAGPVNAWNDRQDINPFLKIGTEAGLGIATGEPINGVLGGIAKLAGLGKAAQYVFPSGLGSLNSLPVQAQLLDPMADLGTAAVRQFNRKSDDNSWYNTWSSRNSSSTLT